MPVGDAIELVYAPDPTTDGGMVRTNLESGGPASQFRGKERVLACTWISRSPVTTGSARAW